MGLQRCIGVKPPIDHLKQPINTHDSTYRPYAPPVPWARHQGAAVEEQFEFNELKEEGRSNKPILEC